MILSPIVLFVYNRPWHTRQTIEALQKNELAKDSELYIYSDAPKNENAIEKVEEVRVYIKNIEGFKRVNIIERNKNFGLANSIIDGVTKTVNAYGKIIVLEDDLVTSPYFLKFMNEALDFYKNNDLIMSISGYTYPFEMPQNYKEDVFLFYRSSSWGWASWRERWNKVDFEVKNYSLIKKNKQLKKKLNKGGEDLFDMLKMQMKGKINSWAIRFALSHSLNDSYVLFPSKSLVHNIGHDGSGIHCGVSYDWDSSTDDLFIPFLNNHNLQINQDIVLNLQKKFKRKMIQRITKTIKELLNEFYSNITTINYKKRD